MSTKRYTKKVKAAAITLAMTVGLSTMFTAAAVPASAYTAETKRGTISYNEALYQEYKEVCDKIENGLRNYEAQIDVANMGVTTANLPFIYKTVIKRNPDIFYVDYTQVSTGKTSKGVVFVCPQYKNTPEDIKKMGAQFNSEADSILSGITPTMTDLEKAAYIHDEIALRYEYNNDESLRPSAYQALTTKITNCQGYSSTYSYLLSLVGIDSEIVDSSEMVHLWNKIKIDGEYYNVDVTWDDPIVDKKGHVKHQYFLLSDKEISKNGKAANSHYGFESAYYKSNNTKYDNRLYHEFDTRFCFAADGCYAIDNVTDSKYGNSLLKYDLKNDAAEVVKKFSYRWNLSDGNYYKNSFMSLDVYRNIFYYNSNKKIYAYDVNQNAEEEFYSDNSSDVYYGLMVKDGKVYANVSESPTVLGKFKDVGECIDPRIRRIRVVEEATSVKLNTTSATLNVGESVSLTATVAPTTASQSVTWSTSNGNVATVSNGKITAKAVGTATITAQTANGKTATCAITVKSDPTSVKLNTTSATLNVGESVSLTATVAPTTASQSVTWSTSNGNVATVSNGKVTAKDAGTATITAKTTNGKTATCAITVKAVAPTSVKLNKTSATLNVGESVSLTATVAPTNASQSVTWSTSNGNVATVSNGKVTAKSAGTATITAKTTNGKTTTCAITVKAVAPTSVKLNKTSATLNVGESVSLTATVAPTNASQSVTWSTSNGNVATVSNGKVTAKGAGTATITAKTTNGKTATCAITVKAVPTSVKLNKTSATLNVGESVSLTATVAPSNASQSVTWSTSNGNVATVSNGKITAKGAGTATITAKTYNGKTATCAITVKALPTSVNLNKTSVTLGVGESISLTATVAPTNASQSVTWSTSNGNVATVSNGKVTAKGAGTATITAKTTNGKTATCKVTVKAAPTSVKLNTTAITLGVGEKYTIKQTVSPSSYAGAYSVTSSNTSIATVDKNGVVTPKKAGTATITFKYYNGVNATCKVTVKNAPDKITMNKTSMTMKVGQTTSLSCSLNKDSASNTINWSSSNSNIVSVSSDGKTIKAKAKGTATITVKTFNGKTATCKITVN